MPEPKQPSTCGTCRFGKPNPNDLKSVVCFGAPPTPVMMGARQVGMQMQFQIENMRPILPRTTEPCARYEEGSAVPILGAHGPLIPTGH